MDGASILTTLLRWTGEYNLCAARHNALVSALKPGTPNDATAK